MSDRPDPAPPPDAPAASGAPASDPTNAGATAKPPTRRSPWASAAAGALTLSALLALGASAPWTEFGTQVLLSFVPGLRLNAPSGTLFGDFQADRLSLALGDGRTLVIDRPEWRPWHLERRPEGGWQLHTERLAAARASVQGQSQDPSPTRLPANLRLPLGVQIDTLALEQLDLGLPAPLRELRAGVSLAAGGRGQHRLTDLQLAWERLEARGAVQIANDEPLAVQATLAVKPKPAAEAGASSGAPPAGSPAAPPVTASILPADWQARLEASGPLAALEMRAQIDAAGQHLAAEASVALEAAWPLTRLRAEARDLDLAPLGAGLPRTALSGQVLLQPVGPGASGAGAAVSSAASAAASPPSESKPAVTSPTVRATRPVRLQVDLTNARPGRAEDGALPVAALQVSAQSDIDRPDRGRLERLALTLADATAEAGEVNGDGQWQLLGTGADRMLSWSLQTEVKDLQPARLASAAPGLRLRGPVASSGAWPWPASVLTAASPTPREASAAKPARSASAPPSRAARLAAAKASAPAGRASDASSASGGALATHGGVALPPAQWRLRADLGSQFETSRLPEVRLQLQAQGTREGVEIERFEAVSGASRARLQAQLQRLAPAPAGAASPWAGPWRLTLDGGLQEVDPTVWWPGLAAAPASPWRRGPHRLNASATAQLTAQLPAASADLTATRTGDALLRSLQGQLKGELGASRLGGLPLSGRFQLDREAPGTGANAAPPVRLNAELNSGARNAVDLDLGAASNRIQVEASLDTRERSNPREAAAPERWQDRWQIRWTTPQLSSLGELARLLASAGGQPSSALPVLEGDSDGQLQLDGRWPAIASQGRANARQLAWRAATDQPPVRLRGLDLQWQGATSGSQELSASLKLDELRQGEAADAARLEAVTAELRGRPAAHRLTVQADLRPGPNKPRSAPDRGRLRGVADGALASQARDGSLDWTGQLQALSLRALGANGNGAAAAATTTSSPAASGVSAGGSSTPAGVAAGAGEGDEWLRLDSAPVRLHLGPDRQSAELGPTRLHADRSVLAIDTAQWQQTGGQPPQIRLKARLESLLVVPWLQRAQPEYGWRGDLRVAGSLEASGGPGDLRVEAELRREQGDLVVDEPALTGGPQPLGLSEIRLGLSARAGRWRLSQRVVGRQLGTLEGEQVVQAAAAAWAPGANDPVSGRVDLRIEQLGKVGDWGRWLPAGWRVGGQVQAQARVGGQLGSPRFSGELKGQQITVRNPVEGVDWQNAELLVALDGENARIEQFSVQAGSGRLDISGQAALGATPRADLVVKAERFAVLQRVDRRLVVSGQTSIGLSARTTSVKGSLRADEGRIDFTRSDAPALADDVDVVRPVAPGAVPAAPGAPKEPRRQELDLKLDLGKAFALKGRGLNTRLEGELHLTSPANRLAANGTIRAVDGTYAAYGQKLGIDRGEILFRGAIDNPRLDIQATRPDLDDVRVGVAITGTSQNPRIRLFSDPEMTDNDKLSWLLLGRASDGLARTDLALLQRAAYALVAGESDSPSLMQRLGVDTLSVRQDTDGTVRETVVSLGKQISRRWYVGYERSLNATAGTWQLVYRIAQRFTLRAQSGAENAIDFIWTWKWGEPAAR